MFNFSKSKKSHKTSVQTVEQYYDEWTDRYLKYGGDVIQALRTLEIDELLDYTIESAGIRNGMHILDAGCGICGPSRHFAKKLDVQIDAITISQVQVQIAKEKNLAAQLDSKINVTKGDYHRLDQYYPGNSFDGILFLEALGHAYNPEKVIMAASTILKKGGFLYIKDFFLKEISNEKEAKVTEKVIENTNKIYAYNTLDLHQLITNLRLNNFDIRFIKRPEFNDDIRVRVAFEKNNGIDLFDGGNEFAFSDWFEIQCQKQ